MSQTVVSTSTYITPKAEDLLRITQLNCTINGCQSVFKNVGNLQMHLEKHHKILPAATKDTSSKLYLCPQLDCIYHEKSVNKKHFKSLKYLRQHYQKVHAEKCFNCSKCAKAFGTESMRDSHERNYCGKTYICIECGWSYDSPEALLTHAKRRGHPQKRKSKEQAEKLPIARLKEDFPFIAPEQTHRQTQTENNTIGIALPPKKRMKVVVPEVNHFHETPLCDIETQTELNLSSVFCDPMLYSHMHTQTCDGFLSELGLADIQTQTNWSSVDDDDDRRSNSRKEEFSSGAHDELMVSTETQTSFTQFLLDTLNVTHNENLLGGCITQHTQTCDTLLGGLFDGQDNDFIGSFQSTHTQT